MRHSLVEPPTMLQWVPTIENIRLLQWKTRKLIHTRWTAPHSVSVSANRHERQLPWHHKKDRMGQTQATFRSTGRLPVRLQLAHGEVARKGNSNMGKWIACGMYALVKTALMVAVVSLPTSKLWKKPTHWLAWIELASAVVLSSIAYMQLQGSDPGYLCEELLWKEEDNSTDEQLLTSEDDDESLSGSDDDSVALQIRSHSGLDAQKQYRLDKIRRIQETLRALEKHSSEDSTDGTDGEASTHPSSMTAMEFCEHCDLFPPLRSHHCRPCGKCVATFDHHCFVLATCIGEKNHCRFWWFLFLETCEILAGLDVVYSSFRPASIKHTWIHANIYGFLLTTLLLILLLFVGSLLAFHTFVAMTGTTSYEFGADHVPYLDGFHDCDLPFSRGLFHNLNSFCCETRKTTSWIPTRWLPPAPVDRDGDKVCENIWENKYYSCC